MVKYATFSEQPLPVSPFTDHALDRIESKLKHLPVGCPQLKGGQNLDTAVVQVPQVWVADFQVGRNSVDHVQIGKMQLIGVIGEQRFHRALYCGGVNRRAANMFDRIEEEHQLQIVAMLLLDRFNAILHEFADVGD